MTDQVETEDDSTGESDGEEESRRDTIKWLHLPILAWAVFVSALLHLAPLLPLLLFEFELDGPEFETHWVEQLEDLEGIGHGMDEGRWADVEDIPRQEEDKTSEQKKPEPKEEPETPEKPEQKDEEKPEPKEEPEEKDEPEEETTPEKPDSVQKAEAQLPERKAPLDKKEPDKPQPSDYFTEGKQLPGVDRGGPNEIPNLKNYGPGNARMTGLVRVDRVRGTPYEDAIRKVLQNVPDFRILAHSTGFDPIDDMNSFFMASARPQYLQHTFLAVRHDKSNEEIKDVLDRRFQADAPWKSYEGKPIRKLVPPAGEYRDPRKILLADEGLTIVSRPEWLEQLVGELPEESPLLEDQKSESRDEKKPKTTGRPSLIDGLRQIERGAASDDTIVLLSGQGLYYTIPGYGNLRNVEGAKLEISNPDAPTLDIDMRFATEGEARKFRQSCPLIKGRIKKQLGWAGNLFKINELLDKVSCESDGKCVNVHGAFTAAEIERVANQLTPFIPRPRGLQGLPPPPPSNDGSSDAGHGTTSEGDTGVGGDTN